MVAVLAHRWSGNIRELRNVIERIVVLSNKTTIDRAAVVEALGYGHSASGPVLVRAEVVETNARKDEVIKTLTEFNGNKRKAAVSLGISEATLYRWINDLGIKKTVGAQASKEKVLA